MSQCLGRCCCRPLRQGEVVTLQAVRVCDDGGPQRASISASVRPRRGLIRVEGEPPLPGTNVSTRVRCLLCGDYSPEQGFLLLLATLLLGRVTAGSGRGRSLLSAVLAVRVVVTM